MNKIILFNPKSANGKHRIPNSILQVGASIYGNHDFVFVDGNLEVDPWAKIDSYLKTGEYGYFASTVMPGPQLKEAIPFSKRIKEKYKEVIVIWGGYFASNQHDVVLNSTYVDYVVNGPGDNAFPDLLSYLIMGEGDLSSIKNLAFKNSSGKIIKTPKEKLLNQDKLRQLPYEYLNKFYSIDCYLGKTFLGKKTIAYHSSLGCPFTCSFCGIVPIYNGRWKGKSAENIMKDVRYLKEEFGADAIEFHDNNFFTSRKRVVEFSELMLNQNISWWGEGRIDTLNKYSDEDLTLMRNAGLRMIFLGAETGNDEILLQMNKGGTQSGQMIKEFAARLRKFDIIPEFSFVLGMPAETTSKVGEQIDKDIQFIKEIKEINPDAEIIIYLYSPVPTEGSELYDQIIKSGFSFPSTLEDWLKPDWENFDLRKNPLTPWLEPYMVDKIKNFETVLNAQYPTVSDYKLTKGKKKLLRSLSSLRYKSGIYQYPYELKIIQKLWRYRQPEIEGFYSE